MQNKGVRGRKLAAMRTAFLFLIATSGGGAGAAFAQVALPAVPDSDGDGIDDVLEAVLNTNPLGADSDGDGWNDGIELARRSDPLLPPNVPGGSGANISVGLWSRASGYPGYVRTFSFVYLPDGYPAEGLQMEIVVLQSDQSLLVLDESYLTSMAARRRVDFVPVPGDDDALLMVVGANIPDNVIRAQGYMSAATVVWHGADTAPEANVRDRDAIDGFWLQHEPGDPILFRRPLLVPIGGATSTSIYQPIEPSQEPPPDWAPNQICRQSTSPVGLEPGIVILRVIVADCEEGWDAHCSPTECAASVGDEYQTVDPASFIGS